jgi:hypothetical protein
VTTLADLGEPRLLDDDEVPDLSALGLGPPSGHVCPEPGCDGKSFKSDLALKGHNAAKHRHPKASAKKAPGPTKAPARPARPAGTSRRRESTSDLLGGLWSGAATYVVPMASPAAARGMAFVAPGAGDILDRAVAGTPIDNIVLQRFAGAGERLSELRDLVEIPGLLFFASMRPVVVMDPLFQEGLRKAVRRQLRTVVEVMRREREEEAELQRAALELGMVESPDDPIIDQIIRNLLGPIFGAPIVDVASRETP